MIDVINIILYRAQVFAGGDFLELFKYGVETDARYALILSTKSSKPKKFRLFLIDDEEEALGLYKVYQSNLLPMLSVIQNISGSARKLQVCIAVVQMFVVSYNEFLQSL